MALMDWPNLALQFVLGDARKLGSGTQERGERNVPRVEPRPKGVIKVHDEESGAALLDGHADTIPTATDAGAGNRRTRFRLSRANAALPDERLGSICLRDDEVRVGHPLSDDQRRPPGSQVDDAHIAPLPIASEAQHAPAVIRCPVTRGVHVSVDEQLRPRCIHTFWTWSRDASLSRRACAGKPSGLTARIRWTTCTGVASGVSCVSIRSAGPPAMAASTI